LSFTWLLETIGLTLLSIHTQQSTEFVWSRKSINVALFGRRLCILNHYRLHHSHSSSLIIDFISTNQPTMETNMSSVG